MVSILGVCGEKRHGKDTIGSFLQKDFGYTPIGLADPIKRICMDIYGLSYDQCFGSEKETIDERWGLTPRYIMQKVGSEIGREIHIETWTRYCFDKIHRASKGEPVLIHIPERRGFFPITTLGRSRDSWVIIDMRTPEEAQAVRDCGGKIVKVARSGFNQLKDNHDTETRINEIKEDHLIPNDSTLEALREKIRSFVEGLSNPTQ